MMLALKIVVLVVGALATTFFVMFATTFGDCGPPVTPAVCEQGKTEALRMGLPIGLAVYALLAAAIWRWPRILRWPRP